MRKIKANNTIQIVLYVKKNYMNRSGNVNIYVFSGKYTTELVKFDLCCIMTVFKFAK